MSPWENQYAEVSNGYEPTATNATFKAPHYTRNDNHSRVMFDEIPELNPHQQARADFKQRQREERERAMEHRNEQFSWRRLGKQNLSLLDLESRAGAPKVPSKHARPKSRVAEDVVGSREFERAEDASWPALPAQTRPEVNLADLIQPRRISKRTREPVRRADTIPAYLLTGNVSLDDYLDIPDELLADMFPANAITSTQPHALVDASTVSGQMEIAEEDEWEFAAASEFSFDHLSVVSVETR